MNGNCIPVTGADASVIDKMEGKDIKSKNKLSIPLHLDNHKRYP
jgi:hypothetical protein